jgi:hypothetical protein
VFWSWERPEDSQTLAYRLGLLGYEAVPCAGEVTLTLRTLISSPDAVFDAAGRPVEGRVPPSNAFRSFPFWSRVKTRPATKWSPILTGCCWLPLEACHANVACGPTRRNPAAVSPADRKRPDQRRQCHA